jgi:hypothetical protein
MSHAFLLLPFSKTRIDANPECEREATAGPFDRIGATHVGSAICAATAIATTLAFRGLVVVLVVV